MPIATGLALAIGLGAAGIGAAGSIAAGSEQAGAAKGAAGLQYQASQNALDFQKQQYQTQQQNMAPWLQAGQGALGQLSYLLGIPGGGAAGQQPVSGLPQGTQGGQEPMPTGGPLRPSGPGGQRPIGNPEIMAARPYPGAPGVGGGLMPGRPQPGVGVTGPGSQAGGFGSLLQGWNQPFVPPTGATEQNDPGYQFRLSQGLQALQNSAAAGGGLLSGNTAQALENYSQNYASNEYGNVYNRALGQYQQNYNISQNNQANQFNRLASLSGLGQTTAAQLGGFGQAAAGNVGNILLSGAANQGGFLQNAGAARASGYAGAANAGMSALNNYSQYSLLNSLLGGGVGGGVPTLGYDQYASTIAPSIWSGAGLGG